MDLFGQLRISLELLVPALLLFCAFIYTTVTNIFRFWQRQNVKYVPFFGSMEWQNVNKTLMEIESERYNRYGKIYGRFEGFSPVLSVADPAVLKLILTTDFNSFPNRRDLKFHDQVMDNTLFVLEGEKWLRVRNIVSPGFTISKLKKMFPLLDECSDLLVDKFVETGESIDCQDVFGAFVLSTIGRTAFGMNINALKDPKNVFIEKSKKLFVERFSWRSFLTIVCPSLMKVFRLHLLNPETTEFYRETIIQVIEERQKLNLRYDDFLQMLMDTEETNNNGAETVCDSGCNNNTEQPKQAKKGLTHDEKVAQCVTFFIAGYDATTSLLSHLTYRLAMHQDYQERVVEEMRAALDNHDGKMCYEALHEMKFLDAMIHECLRMCPPMVRHERRAAEDYHIKSENIQVKKGTIISIPVHAMHHDPDWYPEPEVFRPERFEENFKTTSTYNYLPFGNGRRICVGMKFVHLQVKLCIAKILMKFKISPAPSTPETLGIRETRNILTVNPVEVCLTQRQSC